MSGLALAGCRASGNSQSPTVEPTTPAAAATPPVILQSVEDTAFTMPLVRVGNTAGVVQRYEGAFPSLSVKTILPLPGLSDSGLPWYAVSITGSVNQLQIISPETNSPAHVITIPDSHIGGIGALIWHSSEQALYLSTGGRLLSWRPSSPDYVKELGDVPRASSIYDLALDSQGNLWGGAYPNGSTFVLHRDSMKIETHKRLASDSDYARQLTIGPDDQIWVGTGSRNPRLYTFHASSPELRREVNLPRPLSNGFITSIDTLGSRIVVSATTIQEQMILDPNGLRWIGEIKRAWSGRRTSPEDGHFTYNVSKGILYGTDTRTWKDTTLQHLETTSPLSLHAFGKLLEVAGATVDGLMLEVIDLDTNSLIDKRRISLTLGEFTIQSLMGHSDGNVYLGGYMGRGLAAINPNTGERWRSPSSEGLVNQVEGLIEFDSTRTYIGSYGSSDIISLTSSLKDYQEGYVLLDRLSKKYHQSRPFGWAKNTKNVFFGTVPDYGLAGGVLGMIDPSANRILWVLNGDEKGFITKQSIIGLTADDEFVYGTSSVRNGYGIPDTKADARVFKLEIATKKKIWERSPVPGAGALYSPQLVGGWLLVADLQGIAVIDPASGDLVAHHILTDESNSARRPGWVNAGLVHISGTSKVVHSTSQATTVVDFESGTRSIIGDNDSMQHFGSRLTTLQEGRVFGLVDRTALAELDLAPALGVSNRPGELLSLNSNGTLLIRFSDIQGTWSEPQVVSHNWNIATIDSFHMVDWFNRGQRDILTQHNDGTLQLHRSTSEGFDDSIIVGNGFAGQRLSVGRLLPESQRPSVLAYGQGGSVRVLHLNERHRLEPGNAIGLPKIASNAQVRLFEQLVDGPPRLIIRDRKGVTLRNFETLNHAKTASDTYNLPAPLANETLATTVGYRRGQLGIFVGTPQKMMSYLEVIDGRFGKSVKVDMDFSNEFFAGCPIDLSRHGTN